MVESRVVGRIYCNDPFREYNPGARVAVKLHFAKCRKFAFDAADLKSDEANGLANPQTMHAVKPLFMFDPGSVQIMPRQAIKAALPLIGAWSVLENKLVIALDLENSTKPARFGKLNSPPPIGLACVAFPRVVRGERKTVTVSNLPK